VLLSCVLIERGTLDKQSYIRFEECTCLGILEEKVRIGLIAVMGFDCFTRTCSWNFFDPENQLLT